MVTSAKLYLKHILFWQGIMFMIFSTTWFFDYTPGRLMGVGWLAEIFEFSPFSTDTNIGFAWLLAGILMTTAGTRLSNRWKWLENAGFVAGITVPLLAGLIFLAAFLFGGAENGYIVLISYTTFTAPLLAYLRLKPQDLVHPVTEAIDIVEGGENAS